MLILMFSRWLTFEYSSFCSIARVIRKSNDKSYRARSVSVVDQKLLLSIFQGELVGQYRNFFGTSDFGLSPSIQDLGFLYTDLPGR